MCKVNLVILTLSVLWIARWTTCATPTYIKCYFQVCNRKDPNSWLCHYPGEGIEWKCEENQTCSETGVGSDGIQQQLMRGCSEENDVAVETEKNKGEICKSFDNLGLKYCYCNTPMCNTKIQINGDIEVLVKDEKLHPKQSS